MKKTCRNSAIRSSRLLFIILGLSQISLPLFAGETNQPDALDRTLKPDSNLHYFLFGAKTNAAAPSSGYGLVLILPGGDGGKEFLPFCKQIRNRGIPTNFIAAELVASKWKLSENVVWPTKTVNQILRNEGSVKEEDMPRWTTEEFIEGVINDIGTVCKIDPRYVFTLSWSSSGHAAYTAALSSKLITGSFVAMGAFVPGWMPPLTNAAGRAFYLYHSPDDQTTPFFHAETAKRQLSENGAKVEMKTYSGGHGWQDPNTFDTLKNGFKWLMSQQPQTK